MNLNKPIKDMTDEEWDCAFNLIIGVVNKKIHLPIQTVGDIIVGSVHVVHVGESK